MVLGSTVLNDLYSKKEYSKILKLFKSESSLDSVSAGKFISASAFHFFKNSIGGDSSSALQSLPRCIVSSFSALEKNGSLGDAEIAKHVKSYYFIVQERYLKEKRFDLIQEIVPVLESFLNAYKGKTKSVFNSSHSTFAFNLVQHLDAPSELVKDVLRISDTYGSSSEPAYQALLQGWVHFWKFYHGYEKFKNLLNQKPICLKKKNSEEDESEKEEDSNPFIACHLRIKDEEQLLSSLQQSLDNFKKGLSTSKSISKMNSCFQLKKLLRVLHIISEFFLLFMDHKRSYSALILVLKFAKEESLIDIESCALLDWSKKLILGKYDERLKHLCQEYKKGPSEMKVDNLNVIIAVAWSLHRQGLHLRALEILGSLLASPDILSSSSTYLPLAEANFLVSCIQNVVMNTKEMAQHNGGHDKIETRNPMCFLSEASKYLAYVANQLSNVSSMTDNLNALLIYARYANISLTIINSRYHLYRKFSAGLQSRLYIKLSLEKAQEFGALVRVVNSLLNYADLELSFDDYTSANLRLLAVEYIMQSGKMKRQQPVSARREKKTKKSHLSIHDPTEDTGASPRLVANAFAIPTWGKDAGNRTIYLQSLSAFFISLQSWVHHLAGEIELFKQYSQGLDSMERQFLADARNDETRILESIQSLSYEFFMGNERVFECFAESRLWDKAKRTLETQKKRISNTNKIDHPFLHFELKVRILMANQEESSDELPDPLGNSFEALRINVEEAPGKTPTREKVEGSSHVNAPIKKSIPVPIGIDMDNENTKDLKMRLEFDDEKSVASRTRARRKKSTEKVQPRKQIPSSTKKPSRI